jgi:hypothetical protein
VFPMRAHFPQNETLDSLSTKYSIYRRVKAHTAGRGQWGMDMTERGRRAEREDTSKMDMMAREETEVERSQKESRGTE